MSGHFDPSIICHDTKWSTRLFTHRTQYHKKRVVRLCSNLNTYTWMRYAVNTCVYVRVSVHVYVTGVRRYFEVGGGGGGGGQWTSCNINPNRQNLLELLVAQSFSNTIIERCGPWTFISYKHNQKISMLCIQWILITHVVHQWTRSSNYFNTHELQISLRVNPQSRFILWCNLLT